MNNSSPSHAARRSVGSTPSSGRITTSRWVRSMGSPARQNAWITLAGLARDTRRIRLGSLLSAATFRLPAQLAVIVAQVDAMSGGRTELRARCGLVRGGAPCLRHPVPPFGGRAVRSARGATRDRVGDVGSREPLLVLRQALPDRGQCRSAQTDPRAASADHRRRKGLAADPGDRGTFRRRVQCPLRACRALCSGVC